MRSPARLPRFPDLWQVADRKTACRTVGIAFQPLLARATIAAIASVLGRPFAESIRETSSDQHLPRIVSIPSLPQKQQC